MSGLGIDASVVVAWLFDDEDEPRADRALEGRRFRVGEDQAVMSALRVQRPLSGPAGVYEAGAALCQASDEAFYNTSPGRLRDLTSRARQHWCTRGHGAANRRETVCGAAALFRPREVVDLNGPYCELFAGKFMSRGMVSSVNWRSWRCLSYSYPPTH